MRRPQRYVTVLLHAREERVSFPHQMLFVHAMLCRAGHNAGKQTTLTNQALLPLLSLPLLLRHIYCTSNPWHSCCCLPCCTRVQQYNHNCHMQVPADAPYITPTGMTLTTARALGVSTQVLAGLHSVAQALAEARELLELAHSRGPLSTYLQVRGKGAAAAAAELWLLCNALYAQPPHDSTTRPCAHRGCLTVLTNAHKEPSFVARRFASKPSSRVPLAGRA